jgi:hypothetical protein
MAEKKLANALNKDLRILTEGFQAIFQMLLEQVQADGMYSIIL